MRLRQVALVVGELEPVVDDLCTVLGIRVGFRDPGVAEFGLHNAVMPIGDTFLEVVSPKQPNTTAERYLKRRDGDGGYMILVQCDDLDADRKRVSELGVRIVWQADLSDIRGTHLHPRDVGGAILSLDAATPPSSWRWGGPSWEQAVRTDVVTEIVSVDIQSPNPLEVAERWSQVLGRPVAQTKAGVIRIVLDQGSIRFVPPADDRGEGISAFSVTVANRDRLLAIAHDRGVRVGRDYVEIGGVRIWLA